MKFSTFTRLGQHLVAFLFLTNLLVACQNTPSAEDYALRFCTCYDTNSEAAVQLRAGELDQPSYDQLVLECMGEDDPLKELEENPAALLEFKVAFLDAIKANCPALAQSMGY
ncbi:MAG: hypothetical protein ACRBFS_16160 [Aureispira sp.]